MGLASCSGRRNISCLKCPRQVCNISSWRNVRGRAILVHASHHTAGSCSHIPCLTGWGTADPGRHLPLPGGDNSINAGSRHVLHPCSDSRSCYSPAGRHRAGRDAASAPRVLPGGHRGSCLVARFSCPFRDRAPGSGGSKRCHPGITQCVPVGCPVASGQWRAIHNSRETRRGHPYREPCHAEHIRYAQCKLREAS